VAPSQLRLFGEPPRKRRGGIGPAEVEPELAEVARRLPPGVRLGTSSWSFPGWAGIVYDREASPAALARTGLAAYARHPLLRAVGVDRTFYAPVPATELAGYAAQVGEEFRFVVKAPARCTAPYVIENGRASGRNELYLDAAYASDESVAPYVEGLGPKGGALVFQLPPQGDAACREPEAFAERLERFLAALPRGPAYAVELRDRKLFGAAYLRALRAVQAAHCVSVHPRMPAVDEQLRTLAGELRGLLVVRWMLGSGLGYDEARQRYEPFSRLVDEDRPTREALAGAAVEETLAGHPVLVIVNNKAEGSAPLSVFRLAERIAERRSGSVP
jgi:uncharacterized protein YecE (DUF72 family)